MKRRKQISPTNLVKASSYRRSDEVQKPAVTQVNPHTPTLPEGIYPDVEGRTLEPLPYGSRVVIDSSRSYDLIMESMEPESSTEVIKHDKKHRTIVVMSGNGFLEREGSREPLSPGSTVVVAPEQAHRVVTTTSHMSLMYVQGYKYDESALEGKIKNTRERTSKAAEQAAKLQRLRKQHKEAVA